MGLRDKFRRKEPTEEEIRAHLTHAGISTKSKTGGREEKFGAFRNYAQDRANQKPGLAPVNPYANLNQGNNNNPYANQGNNEGGNPYSNDNQPSNGSNPSGHPSHNQSSNPYGQSSSNPYGQSSSNGNTNDPYARPSRQNSYDSRQNPYGSSQNSRSNPPQSDPYVSRTTSRQSTRGRDFDEESLDLNAIPSNTMYQNRKPIKKPAYDEETLDLNELPEEDDLNVVLDEDLPQEQEINSEDEEVEAIKQDIRFVKQESLASTRNTLRMAQEADASGTNTLGMLGSQSERLYNAEQNLNLADTQTKIAEEKVKQINRLNRSIFIPATGNPFNKKSRLRMQEQKIKNDKAQEKYMRESNRKNMYESEQRIKAGITNNNTNSELYQKYQGDKDLKAAQRYQFENDSEDDEIEKELASNLNQIDLYAKKLRSHATTMNTEVEAQNERLRKIEEDADRLDINVHMNSTRLSNIR
ncbi:protein transport protein Sec9p [[Candida] jaroonii]|uniref:Protein transport protein Sec9p n=1 Tax=[Candida] jaroonii TaxID=467808 RepID=A0ACA9Y0K6_9ASCO|nr:protein transport protein Sec9p [[Candida] jaroonii]